MNTYSFILLRTTLHSLAKLNCKPIISPQFEEAIYIASLDLWKNLQKEPVGNLKVDQSILKYWIRSCTRCTPFGSFAGTSVVRIASNTDLQLSAIENYIRKVRIDMNYITAIKNSIQSDPLIKNSLLFFPNETLYESPYDFRYVEHAYKYGYRQYSLSSLEKSNYISEILNLCKNGESITALVKALVTSEAVSNEEALCFIDQLIDSQIIVSELEISITGDEPLQQIINCLAKYTNANQYRNSLIEINSLLNKKSFNNIDDYENIVKKVKAFPSSNADLRNVFQLDMFTHLTRDTISKDVIDEIIKQLQSLLVFASTRTNIYLENFKASFLQKFEDSEVPLVIALDADLGVGYADVTEKNGGGSGWVDDFSVGINQSSSKQLTFIQQWILVKYHEYINGGSACIEISDSDVSMLKDLSKNVVFPDGMFALGALMNKNGLFDINNFIFDLQIIGGPSAGNLMSRFAHGDQVVSEHLKSILKAEEATYPDIIFAEIIHLPQARVGNILLRPLMRQYEIPYLGKSGASNDRQLSIHDLMVSVQNNEVVIRSAKLNRRVIPRLTTAHNYTNRSLPLYHFLCDIQNQGLDNPNFWDWGSLSATPYLPRVNYKDIIISKARWNLKLGDFKKLPTEHSEYLNYFETIRVKFKIPKRVQYIDYDNRLLIDFSHVQSLVILVSILKKSKSIILEEFIFNEDNCILKNELDEPFVNEIIIPIRNDSVPNKSYNKAIKALRIPPRHLPDSQWLYYKLYSGVKTQEKILINHILPFLENEISERSFDSFFFIRYQDDRPHLRIRFKNIDPNKQEKLRKNFSKLLEWLYQNKYIDRIINDTYIQEINRYGIDLIHEAEQIFYADSLANLKFISLLDEEDSEFYKLLIGMRSIELYLIDFGLTDQEKVDFIRIMANSYFVEHGGSKILRSQLNMKYKIHQKKIYSFMNSQNDIENDLVEAIAIFKIRSESNTGPIQKIRKKIDFSFGKNRSIEIISSFIHMSINRLFIGKQRRYELLLYTFLERYYSGLTARRLINHP